MAFRRVLVAEQGPMRGYLLRSIEKIGLEAVALARGPAESSVLQAQASTVVEVSGGFGESPQDLVRLAHRTDCQGIHPGYGPLAENSELTNLAALSELVVIGPREELVESLASRWKVRCLAVASAIPVVPGSAPVESPREVTEALEGASLPVWVKDSGGGAQGPLGEVQAVQEAVARVQREEVVWIEAHIHHARHLQVCFVSEDGEGVIPLVITERSVHRNGRLTLDQAPAPLDEGVAASLLQATASFASSLQFRGVGSVDFLTDDRGGLWCIGFRSRLQVGNLLAEELHGLNLAEVQTRLALGDTLGWGEADLKPSGFALGIRIRATTAGHLDRVQVPSTLRFERRLGLEVPAGGLVGVAVVGAPTRQACLVRAVTSLEAMDFGALATDVSAHCEVLTQSGFWLRGQEEGGQVS